MKPAPLVKPVSQKCDALQSQGNMLWDQLFTPRSPPLGCWRGYRRCHINWKCKRSTGGNSTSGSDLAIVFKLLGHCSQSHLPQPGNLTALPAQDSKTSF